MSKNYTYLLIKLIFSIYLILYLPQVIDGYSYFNYFISSNILIAKHIIAYGYIPLKMFSDNSYHNYNFWRSHTETFIHYPGASILAATIHLIGGIELATVFSLPIISVLWIILTICIMKNLSVDANKINIYLASLLYVLASSTLYPYQLNSISYHSLGYISHLFLIYIIIKVLCLHEKVSKYILLFLLINILSLLNYYSATFFNLASLFSSTFVTFIYTIMYKLKDNNNKNIMSNIFRSYLYAFLILFISYVFYDYMFYFVISNYKLDLNKLISQFMIVLFRIVQLQPIEEKYLVYIPPRPIHDRILRLLSLVLTAALQTLFTIYVKDFRKIISLLLIFTSISESIPYFLAKEGTISVRYFMYYSILPLIFLSLELFNSHISHIRKIWKNSKSRFISRSSKKSILILILFVYSYLIIFASYIKLNYFDDFISGFGPVKVFYKSLSIDAKLLSKKLPNNCVLFSDYQFSGELWLSAIIYGKAKESSISPFLYRTYLIYNITELGNDDNLFLFEKHFHNFMIALTIFNFRYPVYGDVYGYAIPPLSMRIQKIFDYLGSRLFDSSRIFLYLII